jgi:hypothetical protein
MESIRAREKGKIDLDVDEVLVNCGVGGGA